MNAVANAPTKKATKARTKTGNKNAMPPGAGKHDKGTVLHFRTFDLKPKSRGEIIEPRENSKRGMLYNKLAGGAKLTLEQIQEIGKENGGDKWLPRDAMDALRLLAKVNRCHIKCDEKTNRFFLVK